MKTLTTRKRLLEVLGDERGFTLSEMMVTTMIFLVVLLALFGIFDMSLKVFSYGNNKVEAVESARVGMEKMEREIRQAYAPSGAQMFDTWTSTQIRFGNDLDGNGVIACPNSTGRCEKIGYRLNGTTLGRDNTSAGTTNTVANLQPVVEQVDYVSPTNTGLRFTYCQRLGGPDTVPNDNCLTGFNVTTIEADIDMVRIQLRVRVDGGNIQDATQTLSTDVAIRNRGG